MREGTQIGIRIGTYAARTYGPAPPGGVEGDRGFAGTIPRSMGYTSRMTMRTSPLVRR